MIKIDINQIEEWEEIKEKHFNYVYININKELSNLYVCGRNLIKKSKKKLYYSLTPLEQRELCNILDGEFEIHKGKAKFYFNQVDNLQNILFGELDNIIQLFLGSNYPLKLLNRIFNYQKFSKNKIGWNRHKLITSLGISVCPYCNRQYITNYSTDDVTDLKATADLDHFYSQRDYPYLSLSLKNLIPSCQICNSRFKGDIDFYKNRHIYPYKNDFDSFNAKFVIAGSDIDYLLNPNEDITIEIKVDSFKRKEIENSIETFRLKKVYQAHTDYVKELILKAIIYQPNKISEIFNDFNDLFESMEEVYRMAYGNYIYSKDFLKRPLSKLTKDICDDLGINFF